MLKQLSKPELSRPEFRIGIIDNKYHLLAMNGHVISQLDDLQENDIELINGVGGGCYLHRERQGVLGIIKYTPIDFLPTLSRMAFNECWQYKDAETIAKRLNQPVQHIKLVIGSNKKTLSKDEGHMNRLTSAIREDKHTETRQLFKDHKATVSKITDLCIKKMLSLTDAQIGEMVNGKKLKRIDLVVSSETSQAINEVAKRHKVTKAKVIQAAIHNMLGKVSEDLNNG